LAAISISWFTGQFILFGEDRVMQASLDAAFFIIYCFAVMALISLLREGAAEVDRSNGEAIQSALQQAKTDAIEKERQRLDALVHDQVLHTLLLAARAQGPEETRAAGESAAIAISSLERAQVDPGKSEIVTTAALFRALENAAQKLDSRVTVEIVGSNNHALSSDVAQAITEATLQALDNSIQHSKAQKINLLLSSDGKALAFSVTDNGTGFRTDRISKDRIGIRTSIQFRMRSIGGEAEIDSAPGRGTRVTLRWPND
jgi:signal transduction histidine kinase